MTRDDALPRDVSSRVPPTDRHDVDSRSVRTTFSRRALLATAATAGTALLAGCSSVRSGLDTAVERDDPGETYVRFSNGGTDVGTVGYLLSPPTDDVTRFRLHVSQKVDGVSSVRLRFKPHLPPGVHSRVLLERPTGSPYPEISFRAGDGHGWTLFEVSDLGAQSSGSYSVDFYLQVLGDDVETFDVSTELSITFDDGLDPRPLRGEAAVTAPGPSDE